jgi:lipase maturation factor 1
MTPPRFPPRRDPPGTDGRRRLAIAGPRGLRRSTVGTASSSTSFSGRWASSMPSAFASLAVQVVGLYGERGILSPPRISIAPTPRWAPRRTFSSPPFSGWGCLGSPLAPPAGRRDPRTLRRGGHRTRPALLALWALYLSMVSAGPVFLNYQWDMLLLEAGFLAPWLAPWQGRGCASGRHPSPRCSLVWLYRWLLFRLMFSSGWVKLRNDEAWGWINSRPGLSLLDAAAADVDGVVGPAGAVKRSSRRHGRHPGRGALRSLADPLGWQPGPLDGLRHFQRLSDLADGDRQFRFLQSPVAWCSASAAEPRRRGTNTSADATFQTKRRRPAIPSYGMWRVRTREGLTLGLTALVLALSAPPLFRLAQRSDALPSPIAALERRLAPFRLVNGYGLFAVMTRKRPELVVESSADGTTWSPLAFRWKPTELERRPRFTGFHLPRLDWQMWFEALHFQAQDDWMAAQGIPIDSRQYRISPWFVHFLAALLQGQADVESLLAASPPAEEGRMLRVQAYWYQFSTPEDRTASGVWWTREPAATYLPALSSPTL